MQTEDRCYVGDDAFSAHFVPRRLPIRCCLGSPVRLDRVPCEWDIRELSPSLSDSLVLARSIRELCFRHRSELGVPLGQGMDAYAGGGRHEDVARMTRLWINDQLADVSTGGSGRSCVRYCLPRPAGWDCSD